MYTTNHFIILIYQLLRETKAYYVPDIIWMSHLRVDVPIWFEGVIFSGYKVL